MPPSSRPPHTQPASSYLQTQTPTPSDLGLTASHEPTRAQLKQVENPAGTSGKVPVVVFCQCWEALLCYAHVANLVLLALLWHYLALVGKDNFQPTLENS